MIGFTDRRPFTEYYDLGVLWGVEGPEWPGAEPFRRRIEAAMADGGPCNLSSITASLHHGAHLDAPFHFHAGGATIDQLPVSDFILPAVIVSIDHDGLIRPDDLGDRNLADRAVLFKTLNSRRGLPRRSEFSEHFVSLSLEAARVCIERKAALVGIDYLSIEAYGDEDFPVHRELCRAGVLILEGLDLAGVPGEGGDDFTLICLPLKIAGADASPVRPVLVR